MVRNVMEKQRDRNMSKESLTNDIHIQGLRKEKQRQREKCAKKFVKNERGMYPTKGYEIKDIWGKRSVERNLKNRTDGDKYVKTNHKE